MAAIFLCTNRQWNYQIVQSSISSNETIMQFRTDSASRQPDMRPAIRACESCGNPPRRVNDRRIDHRALAQDQSTIPQIAIDDLQNPARQLMFFQQATEVGDRGLIGDSMLIQALELAQNRRFIR